jgi:hypothetical protein
MAQKNPTTDHICAKTTYVIWREKHVWNVNVPQREHTPNIVKYKNNTNIPKFQREITALVYKKNLIS